MIKINIFLIIPAFISAEIISNPDENTMWHETGNNIDSIEVQQSWNNEFHDFFSGEGGGFIIKPRTNQGATGCSFDYDPEFPYWVMKISKIKTLPGMYVGLLAPLFRGINYFSSTGKILPGVYICDLYKNSQFPALTRNAFTSFYLYGAEITIDYIKLQKKPVDNFILDTPDEPIKNGDEVRFLVELSEPAKKIKVKLYHSDCLTPLKLNGKSEILLDSLSDKKFAIKMKIESITPGRLKNGQLFKRGQILFVAEIDEAPEKSLIIPNYYDWEIVPAICTDDPAGNALNPEPFRKLWAERTNDENLALGKKVLFSMPPGYRLTKDDNDNDELTDGVLSDMQNDLIWFDRKAVGWHFGDGADNGINFLIDLGESKPVDRVVIRCLGGAVDKTLLFPTRFEVLVSKDGKTFYNTALMQKLAPAEKSLSSFVDAYFLDEPGKAYVYPFTLQVNAEARFIGLRIFSSTSGLFSDELAVIAGDPEKHNYNKAYKSCGEPFYMSGIIIRPRLDQLDVPVNIDVPNFLMIKDMRTSEQRKSELFLNIEAPEGLVLSKPIPSNVVHFVRKDGEKCIKIKIPVQRRPWSSQQIQPLFLRVDQPFSNIQKAVFYTESGDLEPIRISLPIYCIRFPQFQPFKQLHVSLAWMGERDELEWPNFLSIWNKLGFNAISTFPRFWEQLKMTPTYTAFVEEARHLGYKIVMSESPLHPMKDPQPADSEVFCQVKSLKALCPSYRGVLYTNEIARVGAMVRIVKPDYVFMDIETWYNSHITASSCPRCIAAQKKTGLSMEKYPSATVTEILRDLRGSIREASDAIKINMPIVGLYAQHPSEPDRSQPVFDFPQFYPKIVDIAQPSLYYAGNVNKIHSVIRADYKLLKSRRSIPWLTAGTYGEFDPHFLEYIVLESFLNGVGGITYFLYSDFDTPLDFYYHAQALSLLAPYESLLLTGTPVELTSSNPDVLISSIRKDNVMLLLAGNYALSSEELKIQLPFKTITKIQDLRQNMTIPIATNLALCVPKGSIRLLFIQGEKD